MTDKPNKPPRIDMAALRGQIKANQEAAKAAREIKKRGNDFDLNIPDPLAGVDYTGDLTIDGVTELTALGQAFADRSNVTGLTPEQLGFREAAKKERAQAMAIMDSEHWFAMCFETREQRAVFLQAMGWFTFGQRYLNGLAVALLEGIELPPGNLPNQERRIDKRLLALALPFPEVADANAVPDDAELVDAIETEDITAGDLVDFEDDEDLDDDLGDDEEEIEAE